MKHIVMAIVNSSQIFTAGYDDKEHDMYIEFSNESVYRYKKVPKEFCSRLCSYSAHAYEYFRTEIKGKFEYEKTDLSVQKAILEIQ